MLRKIVTEVLAHALELERRPSPSEMYRLEEFSPRERTTSAMQAQEEALVRPRGPEGTSSDEQITALRRSGSTEHAAGDRQRSSRQRRGPQLEAPGRGREVRRSDLVSTLRSSDGVRQALVLQEILGPPRSVRGFDDSQS